MDFKSKHSFEIRVDEAARIRIKYPGRIPVIVEKSPRDKMLPSIDKSKFLVPSDLTVGQFTFVIRKRMTLAPESALFVFCDNMLPTTSSQMGELYMGHQDRDGFLYMQYCGENTFGFDLVS